MVSSARRTNRKLHFAAPSHLKRKIMSSTLSKELRAEHGVSILFSLFSFLMENQMDGKDGRIGGGMRVGRKSLVLRMMVATTSRATMGTARLAYGQVARSMRAIHLGGLWR